MTRINLVHPSVLCRQHLLAEYRELPRVFKLAREWWFRDGNLDTLPKQYTLGKGHVKFFYNKGAWLFNRQKALYLECLKRGYRVTNEPRIEDPFYRLPSLLQADWSPTVQDIRISRQRIAEKLPLTKAQ